MLTLWLSAGFGAVVAGFGIYVIAADATTHGEDWDGIGIVFGRLILVGGLVWALLDVGLVAGVGEARGEHGKSGRRGPLTVVGAAGAVLGVALLWLLLLARPLGPSALSVLLVPTALSAMVLVTALLVVAASLKHI